MSCAHAPVCSRVCVVGWAGGYVEQVRLGKPTSTAVPGGIGAQPWAAPAWPAEETAEEETCTMAAAMKEIKKRMKQEKKKKKRKRAPMNGRIATSHT